ncbi:hypothetical protein WH80_08290 [Streptococcus dysgalactiae subsp. equisimilis]|nr:hypothetical protein WH80_08290 [Streptococcus dysgalactiae subsp. equisimilis]OBY97185.1 hypothetical protein BBG03_06555 [Streptococcus dysgalactiae subsp. equisimilis]OBZ05009.1 hypothetical protein BBG04_06075 [Streptococcus dysgalactiae subsp. equisimilis]OCX03825.1 hypothetical protein BBG07_03725 [Streptococcus dysgalactiae subsp. equisimilis]BAN93873.1 aminopeptidase [Streptococcus dysgalactiae subsp. equisimilis 167]
MYGVLSQERVGGDFVRWDLEVYVPILGIGWVVKVEKAREGGDEMSKLFYSCKEMFYTCKIFFSKCSKNKM